MRGPFLLTLLCTPVAFGCGAASAGTTQSFVVSADIVTGCSVVSVAGGSWGNINLGTAAGVQTGNVSATLLSGSVSGVQINCTPGTTLSITADTGNQSSGGVRQLAITGSTTARIPYQLYANGSTTPWTTQAVSLAFPVGTSTETFPISATATLPGVQQAGAYSDTVRVTIAW